MKRRIVCFCAALICALMIAAVVPVGTLAEFDPNEITTPYVVLVDAETGTVLWERASHDRAFPASTTKVMTCILAIEKCEDLEAEMTVGNVTNRGSVMGLSEGERIKIIDVLYGLMMVSGNDAAEALAKHIAGSKGAFAEMMNQKAAELGMTATHFVNANGLHNEEHYSTAYDMALLARYAMKNETFRRIVSSKEHTVAPTNRNKSGYELVNSNRLLVTPKNDEDCEYEYATGIKTGNTREAGYCLIASAEKDGRELIAVLLGDNEDRTETYYRFRSAKSLFEWAFENIITVNAASLNLQTTFETSVNNASFEDPYSGKLTLNASVDGCSLTGVRQELSSIIENASLITATPNYAAITAPIKKGDVLGTVTYEYDGKTLFSAELVASRDVAAMGEVVSSADPITIGEEDEHPSVGSYLLVWILVAVLIIIIIIVIKLLMSRDRYRRRGKKRGYYVYRKR